MAGDDGLLCVATATAVEAGPAGVSAVTLGRVPDRSTRPDVALKAPLRVGLRLLKLLKPIKVAQEKLAM